MKTFLIAGFIVLVILFGPIATIWSLNTLFPVLKIPYSIDTWMAVVVLGAAVTSYRAKS